MHPGPYLERIGLSPDLADADPTLDLLETLQRAHVTSVPFENLDIVHGVPIELDREAFYRKLVTRSRGGFCYELNGLFEWLLRELGFETTVVSGRVADEDGSLGPPFDHLAVLVEVADRDGRYLADVGNGDFARQPLPMSGGSRADVSGEYRVTEDGAHFFAESRDDPDGEWSVEYRFTDQPRDLPEFADTCEHHQTSDESPFTRGPFVTMATDTGRVTLSADSLTVTDRGDKRKHPVPSNAEWEQVLAERFGIRL